MNCMYIMKKNGLNVNQYIIENEIVCETPLKHKSIVVNSNQMIREKWQSKIFFRN